ncbi:MAG TPA: hypothetical protein VGK54_11165 [Chloroflexota bacterium]|jgi:hypothetical protein
MSGNGSIARTRVINHLMDDAAQLQETLVSLDQRLVDQLTLYRHDRADDPIQERAIQELQALIDHHKAQLAQVTRQIQNLQAGNGLQDQPYREEART